VLPWFVAAATVVTEHEVNTIAAASGFWLLLALLFLLFGFVVVVVGVAVCSHGYACRTVRSHRPLACRAAHDTW
jgi:hypothetical protein